MDSDAIPHESAVALTNPDDERVGRQKIYVRPRLGQHKVNRAADDIITPRVAVPPMWPL